MDGVEVMVDGVWKPVPSVKATGFEPVRVAESVWAAEQAVLRSQYRMRAKVRESTPGALWNLMQDAEARARVARWAARWWLAHPYVPRTHNRAREGRLWSGATRRGGTIR